MKYNQFKYGQYPYSGIERTFIYARNENDITNKTEIAYFNYTDMNRLEDNTEYIVQQMETVGFTLSFVKKTWILNQIPRLNDIERILTTVKNAAEKINADNILMILPSTMQNMNYNTLNNLERAMYLLCVAIKNIKAVYNYSGTIYSGE